MSAIILYFFKTNTTYNFYLSAKLSFKRYYYLGLKLHDSILICEKEIYRDGTRYHQYSTYPHY